MAHFIYLLKQTKQFSGWFENLTKEKIVYLYQLDVPVQRIIYPYELR
ncbi:TPA: hypothetical protein ACT96X_002994 [Legionella pneumophila]|nr:hypothetical protein [Legionella pneumophila]HAT1658406.1 hypothetical protein [Legionella pneumophila]HAT1660775.1 hypothetical protein [Legionella pneumophila]HAT1883599.1 hypothetical protein [Legionella pneumophila]HAT1884529.1 hypothetical protein [Legionella pneumophila]HAT2115319.1 hypothetical protein [Legionella pneumophila]